MNRCQFCRAVLIGESDGVISWACGTYAKGTTGSQSARCQSRAADQDVEADNEVTRRRMHQHFEPEHYGT